MSIQILILGKLAGTENIGITFRSRTKILKLLLFSDEESPYTVPPAEMQEKPDGATSSATDQNIGEFPMLVRR